MNIIQILNEAIPLRVAKKEYTRDKGGAYRNKKLNTVFDGKDRLIIPVDFVIDPIEEVRTNPLIRKIREFLGKLGYTLGEDVFENYIKGVAFSRSDKAYKNPTKIGKILQKSETDGEITVTDRNNRGKKTISGKPLLHAFKNDPSRQGRKDNLVVISRHPYDIAGMSTDRSWTSCMNIGTGLLNYEDPMRNDHRGAFYKCVDSDIRYGSIVAYMIKNSERLPSGKVELKRPLSRVIMRPFLNDAAGVAYGVSPLYGVKSEQFKNFVKEWVAENLNYDVDPSKPYRLMSGLYAGDNDTPVGFTISNLAHNFRKVAKEMLNNSNEDYMEHIEIGELDQGDDDNNGASYEITLNFKLPQDIRINDQKFLYLSGIGKEPLKIQKLLKTVLAYNGTSGIGVREKLSLYAYQKIERIYYRIKEKDFSFTFVFSINLDRAKDLEGYEEVEFFETMLRHLQTINWHYINSNLIEIVNAGTTDSEEKIVEREQFQDYLKTMSELLWNALRGLDLEHIDTWKKITAQDDFYYNYYKICHSPDSEKARAYRKSIYPFKESIRNVFRNIDKIDEVTKRLNLRGQDLLYNDPAPLIDDGVKKVVQLRLNMSYDDLVRLKKELTKDIDLVKATKPFSEHGEKMPPDFFEFLEDEGVDCSI